jgi:hypothetical protein
LFCCLPLCQVFLLALLLSVCCHRILIRCLARFAAMVIVPESLRVAANGASSSRLVLNFAPSPQQDTTLVVTFPPGSELTSTDSQLVVVPAGSPFFELHISGGTRTGGVGSIAFSATSSGDLRFNPAAPIAAVPVVVVAPCTLLFPLSSCSACCLPFPASCSVPLRS